MNYDPNSTKKGGKCKNKIHKKVENAKLIESEVSRDILPNPVKFLHHFRGLGRKNGVAIQRSCAFFSLSEVKEVSGPRPFLLPFKLLDEIVKSRTKS
jgi:hypothetical protein